MASAYPGALDALATTKSDDTDSKSGADLGVSTTTGDHAQHHNDLADAINKVEAELGVSPKGNSATVRARLEESSYKQMSCRLATNAANVAGTYANGTAGVGATKAVGGTTLTIDGVAVANGDRVLLKDQTSAFENGVYVVSGVGTSVVLTRATDDDTSVKAADAKVLVDAGTWNADTEWYCSATAPTIGTTSLPFRRTQPIYGLGNPRNPWDVAGNTTQVAMATAIRAHASSTVALPTAATHTLYGGITLPAGRPITNVNFFYTVAAATITIYYVSLIRLSDRAVLATSANATGAWSAAPAIKTTALSSVYTPTFDTPVYVGIALAATTGATIAATPAFPATTGLQSLAPILVGTTTTPTTTPITGTAAALAATVGGIGYVWLT